MALPDGWESAGWQVESGQAWLYCVVRRGASDLHALKRLKNPNRSDRFKREVETMIRLRGTGAAIPEIVDADLEDGHPWFAMPWCTDGSLQAMVDDQRYRGDLLGGVKLLVKLAKALADVHAEGVAHRDLKPANVLVEGDDLLLTDFGLCFDVAAPSTRLTETMEAVGSRLYIAPENESGFNEEVDQRPADFYAFGKLIWAVLAGKPPLARELIVEPGHRLRDELEEIDLAPLDDLLRSLVIPDPRARMRDWPAVMGELDSIGRTIAGERPRVPGPVGSDTAVLVERFRGSGLVAQGIDAAREQERRAAWFGQLIAAMQTEARRDMAGLRELADELSDVLRIAVAEGSPPDSAMGILAGLDLQAQRALPVAHSESATVFHVYSPQGVQTLPTLTLTTWPLLTQDALMVARVPLVTEAGLPQRPPPCLSDRLAAAAGPFQERRAATIDACRDFVRETAQLFIPLAYQYVEMVGRGKSPADAQAWADVDLLPAELVDADEAQDDVSPPELRSLDVFPTTLTSDNSPEIRIRSRIVDRPAGIARDNYPGSPSQLLLRSRAGQTAFGMFTTGERIEGDEFDGVYETVVRLDPRAERGRWTIESVLVVDQTGNSRSYTTAELRGLGYPTTVRVE